ncbi:ribosome biogenesis GTPase Der [candidate division KSB1 bacterium]|nr:ribosome biogenesis GTPase Der [candidate division KSB1 bacterium]
MSHPTVAIIGRPNVGKSTLFNRIVRRREAIVDDQPGVTRDRLYHEAEWAGRYFNLIDTGGYLPDKENMIHMAVLNQVMEAISEADVIIFLVDARAGLTSIDEEIARILQKTEKPILLVVNKVDDTVYELDVHEFYALGLGDPIAISASGGRNIGDFLDEVIALFPESGSMEDEPEESIIRLAIVGKPNVGKSSFVNAIIGKEKMIVTEIPGTTRDSIDTPLKREGQQYLLVDTAGLRKKSKVKDEVEYYSNVRSIKSLRNCDVAIILIDARDGIQDQDKSIIEHALKSRKGIVLGVNKWDLVEKDTRTAAEMEQEIKDKMPYLQHIPVVFLSALTKQRVYKVIDIANSVYHERVKRVSTSVLNDFLEHVTVINPPPAPGGKHIKIKFCSQVKVGPPVFAFFANYPQLIKQNYRQFLENKLREHFGFFGVPLTLTFRRK